MTKVQIQLQEAAQRITAQREAAKQLAQEAAAEARRALESQSPPQQGQGTS